MQKMTCSAVQIDQIPLHFESQPPHPWRRRHRGRGLLRSIACLASRGCRRAVPSWRAPRRHHSRAVSYSRGKKDTPAYNISPM